MVLEVSQWTEPCDRMHLLVLQTHDCLQGHRPSLSDIFVVDVVALHRFLQRAVGSFDCSLRFGMVGTSMDAVSAPLTTLILPKHG